MLDIMDDHALGSASEPLSQDELFLPFKLLSDDLYVFLIKLLLKKISSLPLSAATARLKHDFYARSPGFLVGTADYSYQDKYIFLVTRIKKGKTGAAYNRQLLDSSSGGYWDSTGSKIAILDGYTCQTIGQRCSYRFCWGKHSEPRTAWRMMELTTTNPESDVESDMAVCVVYNEKDKVSKAEKKERENAAKALRIAHQTEATSHLKAKAAAERHEKAEKEHALAFDQLTSASEYCKQVWARGTAIDFEEEMLALEGTELAVVDIRPRDTGVTADENGYQPHLRKETPRRPKKKRRVTTGLVDEDDDAAPTYATWEDDSGGVIGADANADIPSGGDGESGADADAGSERPK